MSKSLQQETGEDFELDSPAHEAFLQLMRTSSKLENAFGRLFKSKQLSHSTYNILRVLDRAEKQGRCCGDIKRRLISEVPDVTRLIDRLEKIGYLERIRSEEDRRMVHVRITALGRGVVAQLRPKVAQLHRQQLAHMSDKELETLSKLLLKARSLVVEKT